MLYKDFIAKAAIQIYAGKQVDSVEYAVREAKALAKALEEDWFDADTKTVFFDPEDQPTTVIENKLNELVQLVLDIKDEITI